MTAEDMETYDLSDFDTVEQAEFRRFVADGWPMHGAYALVMRRRAERERRVAQRIMAPEEGARDA